MVRGEDDDAVVVVKGVSACFILAWNVEIARVGDGDGLLSWEGDGEVGDEAGGFVDVETVCCGEDYVFV